jgi:hypothetical protein
LVLPDRELLSTTLKILHLWKTWEIRNIADYSAGGIEFNHARCRKLEWSSHQKRPWTTFQGPYAGKLLWLWPATWSTDHAVRKLQQPDPKNMLQWKAFSQISLEKRMIEIIKDHRQDNQGASWLMCWNRAYLAEELRRMN